jgi:hypothetical protein
MAISLLVSIPLPGMLIVTAAVSGRRTPAGSTAPTMEIGHFGAISSHWCIVRRMMTATPMHPVHIVIFVFGTSLHVFDGWTGAEPSLAAIGPLTWTWDGTESTACQ